MFGRSSTARIWKKRFSKQKQEALPHYQTHQKLLRAKIIPELRESHCFFMKEAKKACDNIAKAGHLLPHLTSRASRSHPEPWLNHLARMDLRHHNLHVFTWIIAQEKERSPSPLLNFITSPISAPQKSIFLDAVEFWAYEFARSELWLNMYIISCSGCGLCLYLVHSRLWLCLCVSSER